jgi:hypothetical protein
MCFIIERSWCQFGACYCRDDICSRTIGPCVGSLKRDGCTLALLVGVYEVNALRILTQQMAVQQHADWIDSSRDKQVNSAVYIVSVI